MDEASLQHVLTADSVVSRTGRTRRCCVSENSGTGGSCFTEGFAWMKLSRLPQFGDETVPSRSHFVDVPHVRQLCAWDCGLACVLMVLRTLGFEDGDIHSLAELCRTTSIWTVDLAHLLHRFSVRFSFLTVTLGANPEFAVETFYKEQLPDDTSRVDSLFKNATQAGISIQCRSISGEEISIMVLSGRYIAIALVDKLKLSHSWLEDFCGSGCCGGTSGYIGHYVVICGYDMDTDEFEIRDPASSRKHERVSLECLEQARKSFGTDEDILLVYLG
ncbi:guanylyl cyclase 1 [Nymphaea colorata]|nr:guanylyl cyclase 1 [Nymphaea colorata]XP_031485479.1 guanylyl cyclase 1 [Nymphaea colorata]XP_031485480.1 guanylyl cyclase 1 [Nymphaea colorata]XP_031485481.1 guanylyl cyclase 1 [Nymphaea colorata]XP_031485482.1 guanylyl cyclase 1 [Nymphaea colorata]XP_031485483.1 guanylyl cyclase 1 [Nymphaea colorata]